MTGKIIGIFAIMIAIIIIHDISKKKKIDTK